MIKHLKIFYPQPINNFLYTGRTIYNDIIKIGIQAGTIKNILAEIKSYLEQEDKSFVLKMERPELYTDKNIKIFGSIENIEGFGKKILENEEYLKNYKYIKEHYGQLIFQSYSDLVPILSDANVKRIGYENIFKFFNNKDKDFYNDRNYNEKFKNIPEDITKEELDKVIEVYGEIPQDKVFYDEKIITNYKKAKSENKKINKLSGNSLEYIIENGLLENLVTILTIDFDKFMFKDKDGIDRLYCDRFKLMNPKIQEQLGLENSAKIANLDNIEMVLEAEEKNLLDKWRIRIESTEKDEDKDIIYSIKSLLLLDEKNNDLSIDEIKRISDNILLMEDKDKKQIEDIIKNNPEYIRLLEIPNILLDKERRHYGRTIRKGLYSDYDYSVRENLSEISLKYAEFQEIRNTIGKNKCIKLIDEAGEYYIERLYAMMQEAHKNNKLKTWSKLLEVDNHFVPEDVIFLDENFFINNSLEDIVNSIGRKKMRIGQSWELSRRLKEYPQYLLAVYSIEELLNLDEKFLADVRDDRYDKELNYRILALMKDKNTSNNLKKLIREIFNNKQIEDIRVLLDKGEKFEKVAHFVPTLEVVKKYPEDQIEKFNKKIWFNLARYDLYNKNPETKSALVEAILTLGVFEKDAGQAERFGLLQKFATYLPKDKITVDEIQIQDDLIKDHFEVLDKKLVQVYYVLNSERLLNDPNILNLFNSRQEAEEEIRKLDGGYGQDYIENALQKEYVSQQYKDIMEYIYKTGYDKYEKNEYTVRLKTDIQQLKMKDKKQGKKLESSIRKIYDGYGFEVSMMTSNKLHQIFDGMDMKYKDGFFEFLRDNLEQIMIDEKKQCEITHIQRQWENIVAENLGQKINFEKCEAYIYGHNYDNIAENEKEIAKLSSLCGYSQEDFEEIQEIFKQQLQRTKSSIPQIEKENKNNGYTYKVLRLDDPIAIFVGELTDCCQALHDAGESCMRHSVTSQNGRILVVQDENGKVLAQSWLWRNKNVLCFDNIEAVEKDSNNKKIVSSEILDMVKQAAKDFVETDKKHLMRWKSEKIESLTEEVKQGKISKKQYDTEITKIEDIIKGQQLSRVTVGIGYTDVDLKGLKNDKENRYPEEKVEYISDSRTQLILYEDEKVENKKTDIATVALYSDSEDVSKLVDIDTSQIEIEDDEDEYYDDEYYDDEYDDDEYYDDEYYDDEYDDEEYIERRRNSKIHFAEEVYSTDEEIIDDVVDQYDIYSENAKINLEDIRKTINHVRGRAVARQAISNIKEILNNERGA